MCWRSLLIVFVLSPVVQAASTILPATQPAAVVQFTVDPSRDDHPISRFIYGINRNLAGAYSRLALTRLGGNRWTAYNWVNNASNAGNDYHYQNDGFLSRSDSPGAAVTAAIDTAKQGGAGAGAGIILTVPMNGYVSADKRGEGDVRNSGPDYLTQRFRREAPIKGSPFTLTPDPASPVVYQDEFVNWVVTKYPYLVTDSRRPVFFMLDNEPAIWAGTHAEVHPAKLTYDELLEKSIAYAGGIKQVAPAAKVFGPADYGWSGFVTLQGAPDSAKYGDFLSYYLKRMSRAEVEKHARLLDVLDVHWYPEVRADNVRITEASAQPGVVAARLQAPRSLWDASYVESSWITRSTRGRPIRLIPALREKIAANYPGTLLSISEYNYGGGSDISGGLALADALGIFGREGIYAACEWPLSGREPYVAAAFAMFLDYDGKGGAFGDTSIFAGTADVVDSSIYASLDSGDGRRMVLVAINKTNHAMDAEVSISGGGPWKSADVYELTAAGASPKSVGRVSLIDPTHLMISLPPMSVNTIVLAK